MDVQPPAGSGFQGGEVQRHRAGAEQAADGLRDLPAEVGIGKAGVAGMALVDCEGVGEGGSGELRRPARFDQGEGVSAARAA